MLWHSASSRVFAHTHTHTVLPLILFVRPPICVASHAIACVRVRMLACMCVRISTIAWFPSAHRNCAQHAACVPCMQVSRTLDSFSAQQLGVVLWAWASVELNPAPQAWRATLTRKARAEGFKEEHIQVWGVAVDAGMCRGVQGGDPPGVG